MLNAQDAIRKPDKTVIKSLGLGGGTAGGAPCAVDVKDGRILRIRPLHFDWKYSREELGPWKIERNGKIFEPSYKSQPSPYSLAYKKRTYSPNRIKFPLKRIDWDPDGERNTKNRGVSKYTRISWSKAAELIAGELKRIKEKYGPLAVLAQVDGHAECKTVHAAHGCPTLLLEKMGGYTQQVRNPDSWEGWYWGAKHVWGNGSVGLMSPVENVLKDISENSTMVLFWGCDPETTPWGFTGQSATQICYFWRDAGIKQVYVCPDLNYGAAVHADKWIPILPNTDAALQLAIIYVWIIEGTYDKEYVATHTVGYDKVKAYVMGEDDGIAKTPEWASKKCGVPEWTIKALAREFAANITSICHYYGGSYIRGAYSHEPARLEVILLGMQGLGKPGVHQWQISYRGWPGVGMPAFQKFAWDKIMIGQGLKGRLQKLNDHTTTVYGKQIIPKTLIQEAILNPPITFYGHGAIVAQTDDQFIKYTYPLSKEEGGTEIHMVWTDSPCRTTCWNSGNRTVEALRDPKIECVVAQHPWLENDCLIADIILPVSTTLEQEDIVPCVRGGVPFSSVIFQKQAIQPVGESLSDYEAVLEISKNLDMYDEVSGGKTAEEWMKSLFDDIGLGENINWEDFKDRAYFVAPTEKNWKKVPAGFRLFYQEPEKNPLPTPSGKLEFYSESLAKHFPDDKERPPIPKWIEKSESHDERISSERARMFPLLLISNHGRWRVHAQCDDISWTRETPTCKVKGFDDYMYEPVWIHPSTAEKRGIRYGDIVKVFNERGIVLGGAIVWERVMPGVVYMDHGARTDTIAAGPDEFIDRGGAINLISPYNITSKNCVGMATSGYLVDVARVPIQQMEEWRKKYPEAFTKEYDPASGLRFDAWVERDSLRQRR